MLRCTQPTAGLDTGRTHVLLFAKGEQHVLPQFSVLQCLRCFVDKLGVEDTLDLYTNCGSASCSTMGQNEGIG